MKIPALALGLSLASAIAAAVWFAGCHTLSNDCDLNLDCPYTSCKGVLRAGVCTDCLTAACCDEMIACRNEPLCMPCFLGQLADGEVCEASAVEALVTALVACSESRCAVGCATQDFCNPVTNDGCGDGGACDVGGDGTGPANFVCYLGPNPRGLCEPCGEEDESQYCGALYTCHIDVNKCARFCCDDADCGSGVCELDPNIVYAGVLANANDKIGVCLTEHPTDGGFGTPACDAPAVSPSKGACGGGYPPKD